MASRESGPRAIALQRAVNNGGFKSRACNVVPRHQAILEEPPGQLRIPKLLASRGAWGNLAVFAATLKKGAHLQLVGKLRTRKHEEGYGSNKKKLTVKRRVCEVALESILKLDRAERQKEPAPDIEPTEHPG